MALIPDSDCQFFARGSAHTNFESSTYDIPHPLPLPGIVILVHGVNSDGEWYEATERGLCAGLNDRLGRRSDQMKYPGATSGQLTPIQYMDELTGDGYINPKIDSNNFFNMGNACSPVIRFRWGYKAAGEELQMFGDKIYLNEQNYWGGGPFANGCTSLPDLWSEGLSEKLFLWMQVQHMNPVNDRHVYACPPRAYYVLAAYRLAKLIEAIRKAQADVPITIVCHSQGNMIGMAAAFLGDRLQHVTDADGKSGPCVADNYILANAPYSLVKDNFSENWTQSNLVDPHGNTGRQSHAARIATLAAFVAILRQRKELNAQQTTERIERAMANGAHGFNAANDRKERGVDGSTYGRVTLYCNPHDQVISALTVQGIGWRGMTLAEFKATDAHGVLVQRVFAQGFAVGDPEKCKYHYWQNHWRQPASGSQDFWQPQSKIAYYSIKKGLEASNSLLGCLFTIFMAPVMALVTGIARQRVNALPDADWEIPVNAPPLRPSFLPQSLRFGAVTEFDQGYDAPGASRDKNRVRDVGDRYAGDRAVPAGDGSTDAALGNSRDEASLRYEHHALLRLRAKREGLYESGAQVVEEDEPEKASAKYIAWQNKQIKVSLAETVDTAATDHSTIFTNPMHAEKALAYDVAVGVCHITRNKLNGFLKFADWRRMDAQQETAFQIFSEHFDTGAIRGVPVSKWINNPVNNLNLPKKISDSRK
jgi:pimeloyl-ACP methyl ester carboxylesterase